MQRKIRKSLIVSTQFPSNVFLDNEMVEPFILFLSYLHENQLIDTLDYTTPKSLLRFKEINYLLITLNPANGKIYMMSSHNNPVESDWIPDYYTVTVDIQNLFTKSAIIADYLLELSRYLMLNLPEEDLATLKSILVDMLKTKREVV